MLKFKECINPKITPIYPWTKKLKIYLNILQGSIFSNMLIFLRFKPVTLELETKLKAFIPEYIPAVGEVDAFLKIPKPDASPETLGLMDLDEPKLN